MAARLTAINSRNQAKARMEVNRPTGRAMYGKAAFVRKFALMQHIGENSHLLALAAPAAALRQWRPAITPAESHHATDQGKTDIAVAHPGDRPGHRRGVATRDGAAARRCA